MLGCALLSLPLLLVAVVASDGTESVSVGADGSQGNPGATPYVPQGSYSSDWFSERIPVWWSLYGASMRDRPVAVLEIGTFEGRSAEWMLDNLLTHPESTLTVIDTFAGSFEQFYQSVAVDTIETRFDANLARFGSKVRKLKGDSRALLRTFPRQQTFDLVYIDGEHHAASVLEDAVLAFPLLKVGGAMVFDDFGGGGPDGGNKYPRQGVQAFVTAYLDRLQELHVGWQVHLRKVSDGCNIPDCPCKTGGSH